MIIILENIGNLTQIDLRNHIQCISDNFIKASRNWL